MLINKARQDPVLALLKSIYFRAYFRIYLKEKINKKYINYKNIGL